MSAEKRKLTEREKQIYLRLLSRTRPHRGRLALAVLFGILFGGSVFGLLFSAKGGMAQVFGGSATRLQNTAEAWINQWYAGGLNHDLLLTIVLLGVVLFCIALRGLSFFFSKYLIEWVAQRVVMVLRNDVFTKILHLPLLYFTGSRTGELMSRTLNDTQMVERGITEVISDLVQQPFVLVGAAAYLFFIDLRLAFVSLAIFPVCLLPIAIFGKRVRRHAKAGQERIADLSSIQQEAIGGAAIVKAYGMEAHERDRFVKHSADFFRRQVKIVASKAAVSPLMEFFLRARRLLRPALLAPCGPRTLRHHPVPRRHGADVRPRQKTLPRPPYHPAELRRRRTHLFDPRRRGYRRRPPRRHRLAGAHRRNPL
jgi:ATP-binding cassette, subfamily B, bacterial MsbA